LTLGSSSSRLKFNTFFISLRKPPNPPSTKGIYGVLRRKSFKVWKPKYAHYKFFKESIECNNVSKTYPHIFTHRGSRLTNSRDVDVDVVYGSDGVGAKTVVVAKVVGVIAGANSISSRARSLPADAAPPPCAAEDAGAAAGCTTAGGGAAAEDAGTTAGCSGGGGGAAEDAGTTAGYSAGGGGAAEEAGS